MNRSIKFEFNFLARASRQRKSLTFFLLALAQLAGCPPAMAAEFSDSKPVIVAVIDTGIDAKHPHLRDRLWRNAGETGKDRFGQDKAKNGVDDDGNGYIDDVYGWNFAAHSASPDDQIGHGTHVAGIISSIAPAARLMILKYHDPLADDQAAIQRTVDAIRYAVRMGADIINYSAGGPLPDRHERAAIEEAARAGVIFVAAAGNEGQNSDVRHYYPASYGHEYGLTNVLSVTAVDQRSRMLSSSNYGKKTVHLAAPGQAISSSLPGGRWGRLTGTSQATAHATGATALLLAHVGRGRDPQSVIRHLVSSGDRLDSLIGKTKDQIALSLKRTIESRDLGHATDGRWTSNSSAFDPALFTIDAGGDLTAHTPHPLVDRGEKAFIE